MDFSNEPIEGVYNDFVYNIENLARNTQDSYSAILDFLEFFNTIINALVPIIISLILLTGLIYLIRYALSAQNIDESRVSIRGATRAFVALFITINIWTIIRIVQDIGSMSTAVAYFLFFFSFLLFGFWSLFSIGDTFVSLITRFTNWIMDQSIKLLIPHLGMSSLAKRFKNADEKMQRFVILLIVLSIVSILAAARVQLTSYNSSGVVEFEAGEKNNTVTEIPLGGTTQLN